MAETAEMFESVTDLQTTLAAQRYVCDHALATAIFLALKLSRPLFLEGEAGVGNTEVAKVLATVLDRELIRLQCYEGLDIRTAVYEWDYTRQILQVRLMEAAGHLHLETAQ
jgi:MoxR-like ATPase